MKFRAPIGFVFRWCTDHGPGDAKIEGAEYARRVISRSKGHVVYEDLATTPNGWWWNHWTVTLRPPDAWHGECLGNYRNWVTDYRLRGTPNGGTELTLTGKRTPTGLGIGGPRVTRAKIETSLRADWAKFSRSLEGDYQTSLRRRRIRSG